MQRDSRLFSKKASRSLESPAGACYADGAAAAPSFGEAPTSMKKRHEFPGPLNGVEFQPSETCPKNFVIFDQTYSKSRVMFHPSLAHNFGSSSFDVDGTHAHELEEAGKSMYRDNANKGKYPSSFREDAEDIDALLSSEEEEEEEEEHHDDDDAVHWGGSSPNSSCSFSDGMKHSRTKREKMKKMVGTLRGIIPGGGDQMDTPAVLDEAVKYLKSLKVEVKNQLGVRNFDS